MTEITNSRILRVTRWLVYLIMAMVAIAGTVLALVSIALPIYWTDVGVLLAKENPRVVLSDLLPSLLVVFALGVVILGLIWTMMRKLLAIIKSVELGNPFVAANAKRLKAIGWIMVLVQIIGIPLAIAAGLAADVIGESDTGVDFSINGILAILLVFIVAGIFERGVEMREELEGTV